MTKHNKFNNSNKQGAMMGTKQTNDTKVTVTRHEQLSRWSRKVEGYYFNLHITKEDAEACGLKKSRWSEDEGVVVARVYQTHDKKWGWEYRTSRNTDTRKQGHTQPFDNKQEAIDAAADKVRSKVAEWMKAHSQLETVTISRLEVEIKYTREGKAVAMCTVSDALYAVKPVRYELVKKTGSRQLKADGKLHDLSEFYWWDGSMDKELFTNNKTTKRMRDTPSGTGLELSMYIINPTDELVMETLQTMVHDVVNQMAETARKMAELAKLGTKVLEAIKVEG